MGVVQTPRSPLARVPRDTSMNHPLAGAISQANQGGHVRSLTGPHQPPEGQSYAFSFILVGMKNGQSQCVKRLLEKSHARENANFKLFAALAAIFLTCFTCWLRRLLSKKRTSKDGEEVSEDSGAKKNRRKGEVVVIYLLTLFRYFAWCVTGFLFLRSELASLAQLFILRHI